MRGLARAGWRQVTSARSQPPRPGLDEIGLRTGTDKSSRTHNFLQVYDRLFSPWRDKAISVVEIGVHKAASLRMWEEFFPRAEIVGIDNSDESRQYATERVSIVVGDQASGKFLEKMARTQRPHIVIDDGSHVWRHQIETLQRLLPVVQPGGFFVVEAIHTSFGADYAKTYGRDGSTETTYAYLARLAGVVTAGDRSGPVTDDFMLYARHAVESVEFVRNAAILRKHAFPQRTYKVRSVARVSADPWVVDAGGGYPRLAGADIANADREVLAAFARLHDPAWVEVAPAASGEVENAWVRGSGVVTVKSAILDETLNCARNLRHGSGLYQSLPGELWVDERPRVADRTVPAVPGRRHVLLKQTWDANYGHWLIDTLPKVGLLREVEDLSRCLFVLNSQSSPAMTRVVEESLGLFGIAPDQLLFTDRGIEVFEKLTVLGTLSRHPVSKSPLAIEILESLVPAVPVSSRGERLFVSRSGVARRGLANEDEVVALLEEHGYQTVVPQELGVAEQASIFSGASRVVGVMGAGLANLAFAPRGVSVLALATPAMKHDYFYDIVCLKQGRYRGLQGHTGDPKPSLSSDFTIDLDQLRESLAWLHDDDRATAEPPG